MDVQDFSAEPEEITEAADAVISILKLQHVKFLKILDIL
jgi:DNA-directed RNA polymerase subunit F